MKSPSQALMIGLAVALAAGLAFTVALLCVSFMRVPASDEPTGDALPSLASSAVASSDVESTDVPVSDVPDEPSPSLGLRFVSNGDGTCVLAGMGSCADACVVIPEYSPLGDRVTAIATMAFFGCDSLSAVQIPASVREIGDLAFADCEALAYVSVSRSNPYYCDVEGVLYTAGKATLLLYPPMRAGSSVTIHSMTTAIADMAFYRCLYLSRVTYYGSPAQWEQVFVGSQNYSLTAASMVFL